VRATASPDDESKRSEIPPIGETEGSAISAAGELGGAAASSDDASEMTIRGGDGGTASSSGEEGGFTIGDYGLAGSGLTCTGVDSGRAASLGLNNGS